MSSCRSRQSSERSSGSIAGYFGGRVDETISRVIDILLAFPGLLLAIALVAVLGPEPDERRVALSLIGWVGYARLVRGQVLRAREFEFVQAARALGAATPRILARHVIPTALPAVTVQATLGMGGAILAEAALSFLGLGVQPPTPSWGTMLNGGRTHLLDAPHLTIFPGAGDRVPGARLQFSRRRVARRARPGDAESRSVGFVSRQPTLRSAPTVDWSCAPRGQRDGRRAAPSVHRPTARHS